MKRFVVLAIVMGLLLPGNSMPQVAATDPVQIPGCCTASGLSGCWAPATGTCYYQCPEFNNHIFQGDIDCGQNDCCMCYDYYYTEHRHCTTVTPYSTRYYHVIVGPQTIDCVTPCTLETPCCYNNIVYYVVWCGSISYCEHLDASCTQGWYCNSLYNCWRTACDVGPYYCEYCEL